VRERTDDESLEGYLEDVLAETAQLLETVDQVSLIQQLASSDSRPEAVDLSTTLKDLVAEYDEQTAVTFESCIPESAWVWVNPSYDEAFRELIENAVIHNDSDDPWVSVALTQKQKTVVTIADNGPGMPAGTESSLKREGTDPTDHLTSLGLWTVYWTITRSGGTLNIKENEPRGCQIELSLRSASSPEP
jgi:signal transduction histidine kinase